MSSSKILQDLMTAAPSAPPPGLRQRIASSARGRRHLTPPSSPHTTAEPRAPLTTGAAAAPPAPRGSPRPRRSSAAGPPSAGRTPRRSPGPSACCPRPPPPLPARHSPRRYGRSSAGGAAGSRSGRDPGGERALRTAPPAVLTHAKPRFPLAHPQEYLLPCEAPSPEAASVSAKRKSCT